MPISNWTKVTVRYSFVATDENPVTGVATFTPEVSDNRLIDAPLHEIVYGRSVLGALSNVGTGSVDLYATDDPDLTPTGWTYKVVEPSGYTYSIGVPIAAATAGIDLADLAPAGSSAGSGSTFVSSNDPRLTNTRTPTAGSVVNASVATGAAIAEPKLALASDAAAFTASRRTLGTGATQAAAGNDVRLSDTRIPSPGSVVDATVAVGAAIAESKLSLASDAAAGVASRRTLGTGATQAAAGNDPRVVGVGVRPESYDPLVYDGTDRTAALQAAVDAVVAAGGVGVIVLSGRASFASPLNLTGLSGCSIVGASAGYTIGSQQKAALVYTGTGAASAIDATGRKGIKFVNLSLTYTNSGFTGTLVDLSGVVGVADGSGHRFENCLIRPTGTVNSHANLVRMDKATGIEFEGCMVYGDKALYGKTTDASYSNSIKFHGGYLQGVTTHPVWNPGEAWKFDGTVVEATPTTRLPKFIGHDPGVSSYGLTLDSLWVGDDNAVGSWVQVTGAGGVHIHGGAWSVISSGGSLVAFDGASPQGFIIEGVMLRLALGAYVVDLTSATGTPGPVYIGMNSWSNFPAAVVNGTIPNGSIIQSGGSTSRSVYSRSTAQIYYGDVSSRAVVGAQILGDTSNRWRVRADGGQIWLDGAGTTTANYAPNAQGVLVSGTRAIMFDTLATSTLAANGAVAIDAKTCNTYWLTLNANATSMSITNGSTGQMLEVHVIQDLTGGRTYVWPTTCRFAGGSAPADTTPNTRTVVRFRFSGGNYWHEVSRSVAVPN